MVVVIARRVPMLRGASLRSRVKGNFQARFWNSGGQGDLPTDCGECDKLSDTCNQFIWIRCASYTLVVFWSQTISRSLSSCVWVELACLFLASPFVCLLPLHLHPP